MTHAADTLGRAVRRGLATVFAASLLWTTALVPAQAGGDPSAPPDEMVAAEAPIDSTGVSPVSEPEAEEPTSPVEPDDEVKRTARDTPDLSRHSARLVRGGSEPAQVAEARSEFADATKVEAGAVESIHGWVWDNYSYDGVAGIEVEVHFAHSTMVAATAITDEAGFYAVHDLDPGNYQVYFSGEGFTSEWWDDANGWAGASTVPVTADGATEINAELNRVGWVTGKLTTSSGKPIAGHRIPLLFWFQATEDDGYWTDWDWFLTDSRGRFTFPNLRSGDKYYAVDDSELPKGSRLSVEGHYLGLWSYSGGAGNLLTPWIKGQPGTGIPQTAVPGPGKWKKTSFAYQWLRDGVKLPNATRSTYTPTAADRHSQLEVRVTSKVGNNSFSVVSPTSWPIVLTSAPKIKGSVAVGETITAKPGKWEDGLRLRYQWYADGKKITRATADSFTVTAAQKAKKLTVTVTGDFDDQNLPKVSRASAATAKVATAGTPTVSGAQVVGSTLKVKPGTWTKKTKFSYQWLRDGSPIAKATKSSYKLTRADEGKLITVRVTGKRSGYATVAKERPGSVKVLRAGTPSVRGAVGTGSTLTVNPGAWTTGTTFTQQWHANGKPIRGQTGSTLTLTAGHAGKKITVKVTGQLAGHATATTASKATAKVLLVGAVTIKGTLTEGSTLKASPGTWTKKTKLSYQWLRDGAAIAKATKSSYKLTRADVGAVVTVRATGKLSGYGTASAVSPAGGPVAAATPGG